jgi:4-amino-4-deoxy-L-arabinose transferase-like glycosyltransferase
MEVLLLIVILAVSCFLRFYNLAGFPDLFYDEGVYLSRALLFMRTGIAQHWFYDHPFLTWVVLGALMKLVGIGSVAGSASQAAIVNLISIPRAFYGFLGVLETLLVYLLGRRLYGPWQGLLAAALFSMTTSSWLFRRVTLDSVMTLFILSAYLLLMRTRSWKGVAASGALFGLALLSKLMALAFAVAPIALIKTNPAFLNRNRLAILWLGTCAWGPALWVSNAILQGEFPILIHDLLWQGSRASGSGLFYVLNSFFLIDPITSVLGFAGLAIMLAKRNWFVAAWALPAMLAFEGVYVQYFHIIPLVPVLCICASELFIQVSRKAAGVVATVPRFARILPPFSAVFLLLLAFGSTFLLVNVNASANQVTLLRDMWTSAPCESTVLANPALLWIPEAGGWKDWKLDNWRSLIFSSPPPGITFLMVDSHMWHDTDGNPRLQSLYNNSTTTVLIQYQRQYGSHYPYDNLQFAASEGGNVELRTYHQTETNSDLPSTCS